MDKTFNPNSLQPDLPPRIYCLPILTNRQEKVLSDYWKLKIITG